MNSKDVIVGMPVWLDQIGPGTIIDHKEDKKDVTVCFWFTAPPMHVKANNLHKIFLSQNITRSINALLKPQERTP